MGRNEKISQRKCMQAAGNRREPLPVASAHGKRKVVVITDIMAPYRVAAFNALANTTRIDFEVIFFSEMAGHRKWEVGRDSFQFRHRVVPGFRIPFLNQTPIFFNPSLFRILREMSPDVIVFGGYHHPSFLIAASYAKRNAKELILWCESHAHSHRVRNPLAMTYRKLAVRKSTGFLVPGTSSEDYIRTFRVNGKPIYRVPNAVDNHFFHDASSEVAKQKTSHKRERGFPEHLILFVGNLIPRKGFSILLEAYSGLKDRDNVGLLVVGDGSSESAYRKYCRQKGLKRVYFEGFKQQRDLPYYYGISDVLVMPSFFEEWGLVLNEAMACGLPVVASDSIGAARDLVVHGENGYRFANGSVSDLRHRLTLIINHGDQLRSFMGEKSREIIHQFSPEQFAESFTAMASKERVSCYT
jgi:glycosyltransferase involved in cell wall biosynthesis